MLKLEKFLNYYKNRKVAVVLALLGTVTPIPGLHKFYLGQPIWGIVYLLLSPVSISITIAACAIDAVWYLSQDIEQFELQFNGQTSNLLTNSNQVSAIAEALRELNQLREEGLITEYEFEQKRRQLLEKVG
ncbi:MAG: NINE protein [Xenococcaceae cyanobacterium MO_207.B15]|nr:NINE protein [Xenococcaceae cyanobacterium MO_207.B15]MDJ0742082.1 NINE protein [Xenococcaceae cyanobacterium MO_167.B27]